MCMYIYAYIAMSTCILLKFQSQCNIFSDCEQDMIGILISAYTYNFEMRYTH